METHTPNTTAVLEYDVWRHPEGSIGPMVDDVGVQISPGAVAFILLRAQNTGGNISRFNGSGTISGSPNGTVHYQFGGLSGVLAPGASKALWNAASLQNNSNGTNVDLKVDTSEGSIRLGSEAPPSLGAIFEDNTSLLRLRRSAAQH